MRATKEAGPVLDQYHSQLDRAAQGVEGKDPELLQTLRDLSAERYCLSSFIKGKLSEAESAEVLDKGHQGLSGRTGKGNQGSATPHQASPKTKELDLGEDR